MSHKVFIRYTEEDKMQARNADMLEVISRFRGFTFRRDGDCYRCVEHNSLVVQNDRHRWYWNSQSKGGYGAVSWLVDIEGYDFTTAVGILTNKLPAQQQIYSVTPFKTAPKVDPQEKEPFVLPVKADGKYSNVYMYLTKTRCIPADIVTYCFKQKILYQDDHRNCVFVGYDEHNIAKFAEVRSSSSEHKYRKNVKSSDKAYSFNIRANVPTNRVFVFESPIDLLSHAALNCRNVKKVSEQKGIPYDKGCWLKHNRLSLSGTSYMAVLEEYLKRYPEIKNIACCLDNDETGVKTANTIHSYFSQKGYVVTIHHASIGKDYNDTLVELTLQDQQQAAIQTISELIVDTEQSAIYLPPYVNQQLKR